MNKFIISAFSTLLFVPAISVAQINNGKSDLQKKNLKGDVSCVVETERSWSEQWGETVYKLDTLSITYYDSTGNRFLSVEEVFQNRCPWSEKTRLTRKFNRDEAGRLISVDYFRNKEGIDYVSNPLIGQELYEYDSDGRIKSITFEIMDRNNENMFEYYVKNYYADCLEMGNKGVGKLGAYKIIYQYDGLLDYKVILCDKNGSTIRVVTVSDNGKYLSENGEGVQTLDENGNVVSYGVSVVANNGAVSGSKYYGYNQYGDLVLESTQADAVKQIDLAPWLADQYKFSHSIVYEYTYDDNNNWLVKTKKTPDIYYTQVESWAHSIEYGNHSSWDSLVLAAEAKAQREKEERIKELFSNIPYSDQELKGITALYIDYQQKMNEYDDNLLTWKRALKKTKAEEIAEAWQKFLDAARLTKSQGAEQCYLIGVIWLVMDDVNIKADYYKNAWVAAEYFQIALDNGFSGHIDDPVKAFMNSTVDEQIRQYEENCKAFSEYCKQFFPSANAVPEYKEGENVFIETNGVRLYVHARLSD